MRMKIQYSKCACKTESSNKLVAFFEKMSYVLAREEKGSEKEKEKIEKKR